MPYFKQFKKSALSKSYELFCGKAEVSKVKYVSQQVSEATRAGVQEKVEAAVAKAQQQSHPINNSGQSPSDEAGAPITIPALQQSLNLSSTEDSEPVASALEDAAAIKKFTEALLDPKQLWENVFSTLTKGADKAVTDALDEDRLELAHSLEVRMAVKRSEYRFIEVFDFPVKLILIPLKRGTKAVNMFASMLEMQFGPLHAALQVGDIMLEWDDSHLVTPYLCSDEDKIMEIDMQPYGTWVRYTEEHHSAMRESTVTCNYSDQIELIKAATAKKKYIIHALIDVVTRYNKHWYYNLFSRNCQHFVCDALKALEIEIPKELPGGLGEYYKALVAGKTPSVPAKFRTHSDLNLYVMNKHEDGSLADMPQHDLEYLLTLCFHFHVESKARLRKNSKALDEWQCQEENCCIPTLEKLIKIESMKLHNFKTA